MNAHYDFIGVGIGPFHLSLAALFEKTPEVSSLFLERRADFQWHPELLFDDADMQTSFYKDLVTPVDPTSRHSYLNYLVSNGLFYPFMNTGRRVITRREFELYGQWVARNLGNLEFNFPVKSVEFQDNVFRFATEGRSLTSRHLSIATGMTPRIPEEVKPFLGTEVFHAKSGQLEKLDLTGKRVLILGGGQTGVEVFRNALKGRWGTPQDLKLVSRRMNLEPLDESPFTNEYFTPQYTSEFFGLPGQLRSEIVASQKLASDGNTPAYLELLYKDLYFLKHVEKNPLNISILPGRSLVEMKQNASGGYHVLFKNPFAGGREGFEASVVILCTGFTSTLPEALEGIMHLLEMDGEGRPVLGKSFDLGWKGPPGNKAYALNFGRHSHGIAEPQTSLMAWRSATIINDVTGKQIYSTHSVPNFIRYGKVELT